MVYEGNEKYIFVSYAHKDAETVIPIVDALAEDGYRVWYDSGIEAGTEWPEYIEDHLMNAHTVLVFMSPSFIESRNCRNEINFALELKKEILVVYLEETTLLKGMRLQLNSTQSLYRMHHKSDETFMRELLKARILSDCHSTRASVAPQPTPVSSQPAPSRAPAKKKRLPIFVGLAAALAILLVLLAFVVFGGKGTSNGGTATETPVMSDNLFDYTVELEGIVYQLPCRYEELTAQGWTISSTGYSDSILIGGDGYESYSMSNNGKRIYVVSYNMSGNAKPIKDCLISGIECDVKSDVSFKLAKGITCQSTVEEVIAAYGTPTNQSVSDGYTTLTYQQNDSYYTQVRFYIYAEEDMKQYSSISVENRIATENDQTETNPQRPEYLSQYTAPTALGADVTVPIVKLDGDLYQLPAPVSAFTDNGWKIVQQPGFVKSGTSNSITLERNGQKIDLLIINLSIYQTTAENCVVRKINFEADSGVEIELPNGITFGLSADEVNALVTEDFEYDTYSTYSSWFFYDYGKTDCIIAIHVDTNTDMVESISVDCDNWCYE